MFQKATKEKAKLRACFCGPTGSGKTYSALRVAKSLGKSVALIDTEHGSASKYADIFDFDVVDLDSHHPENYIEAIKAAGAAGYEVLVIDSLSHAWMGNDGALELVDKAAKRSQSNNSFTAWRDVTPLHNDLVEAILASPCHVIATMRTKMEYVIETVTRNGKTSQVPKKVGLKPIQKDGVEYEFDIVVDFNEEHDAIVGKTRIPAVDGMVINKPGEDFAQVLLKWLNSGSDAVQGKSVTTSVAKTGTTAQTAEADPDDVNLATDEMKNKILAAGQPNGWTGLDVARFIEKEFGYPQSEPAPLTVNQARFLFGHVAATAPEVPA